MLPDRPPTVPHLPPPTAGCHPAAPVVEKSVISGVVGETPGVHVGAAVVPPVELDPPELVVPPVLDEPPLDDELLALDDPPLDEPPLDDELLALDDPPLDEPPLDDELLALDDPPLDDPPFDDELLALDEPPLDDPPFDDELLALDDPPWLDELPVAVCPPVFWFPLEFVLLQFAIATAKAKHPIHAVIVEKIVAVFPMFPALS